MRKYDPLVDLQGRLQRGEQGRLVAGNLHIFCNKGRLIQAQCKDDVIWVLRRMVVCGYIQKEEASKMVRLKELQGRYFPSVPSDVFQQFCLERAKQNIFRWSLITERPQFSGAWLSDGPLASEAAEDVLATAWVQREKLQKWYRNIAKQWVFSQSGVGQVASLCSSPILLRKVILQSPLEEVYTLEALENLRLKNQIQIGDSARLVICQEETEEEQELFLDDDFYRGMDSGEFQVPYDMIESLEVNSGYPLFWSSKDAFIQFIDELNQVMRSAEELKVNDELIHGWIAKKGWPSETFSQQQWKTERLWRANCISKEVFVDVLFRCIKLTEREDLLPKIDDWVRKWV